MVTAEAVKSALAGGDVKAVFVMAANNETGVIQPIAEIVEIAVAAFNFGLAVDQADNGTRDRNEPIVVHFMGSANTFSISIVSIS